MTSDEKIDPQDVLDRTLRVLDATVSLLDEVPPERRDAHYVRSVTEAVRAAAIACAEQREAMEWIAAHSMGSEEFDALLRQYLARLPRADIAGLLGQISGSGSAQGGDDV